MKFTTMKSRWYGFALFMILLLAGVSLFAQPYAYSVKPYANKFEVYSQMWNPANVYYNGYTDANSGTQLDTATNTTTIYLGTTRNLAGYVNADTFEYSPMSGTGGTITMTAVGLKCTGTPTVTIVAESSPDAVHWAAIPGVATYTVAPTSTTVPVSNTFEISTKKNKYYRLSITGTGSSTTSWQAFILWAATLMYVKDI